MIESAGPAGATLQLLQEAQQAMGLEEAGSSEEEPKSRLGRAAARCWALLLTRIYECLPLQCLNCGQPMRIIAFVLDPPVIERMEPLRDPACGDDWPEMDQPVETPGVPGTDPRSETNE